MKIVMDKNVIKGVFIETSDWLELKNDPEGEHKIFKRLMKAFSSKREFFNLNKDEKENLINTTLEDIDKKALDEGYPSISKHPRYSDQGYFLNEFKDGRKNITKIDPDTGEETFIKDL